MPTIIRTLAEDEDTAGTLADICRGAFLDGECYAFATALHEGLGWSMIGLMVGNEVRHAAVKSPDGRLHDVRGFVSLEQFGRPFGYVPPYDLQEITTEQLHRNGEPDERRAHSIKMARRMAEALFPELPWRDSFAARVSTFATELEALSRKHKLWIRAPVPAAPAVIAIGEDDEGGYALQRTVDGLTFTIDRYFA